VGRSKRIFDLFMRLWPLGKAINRLGNQPLIGPLLRPFFSTEDSEAIIIPIHKTIRTADSVVLPRSLLTPLVERASSRFILDECMCRRGENCQTYPHDIGCLFLGDGAAEIHPTLGRLVGVDEALAHIRQAVALGLVPLIAHSSLDAYVLGIPYRRMLAVCFCCDCCCTIRQSLRKGPPAFWDTVVRLPGLTVVVGQECVSCGACISVCPVRAISLNNGRATVSELCKGCGRCAAVCPTGAIALRLADGADVLAHLLARIDQRTDIWPTEGQRTWKP
jgi:ferredoxin